MDDRDVEPGAAGVSEADADLVDRARAGDRDAMGKLWSRHQHLLLRFLRGVGSTSPDDVGSTVWIDVARGLHRFEGDLDDFRRWLFTIARRRSIDELRRQTRRPESPVADLDAAPSGADAADEFERSQGLERAIALVRTLPADQAEIVLLRIVADLDVAQVAAIVGKTEGNVRVIVHRALRRLAIALDVTDAEPRPMNRVP
ncbi:MAG: sigma-70 family RNA polymerase sigma factor [Actinobacteria bacterium]|nr:sigma-70 family RNA polymerase sigma factor [Actinomycetota bacterium]